MVVKKTLNTATACGITVRFVVAALLVAVLNHPSFAQEKSVKPGVNKPFENPDVADFIKRFEREGRDAFDHQREIVAACQIDPGMSVADIGAGTGLFTPLFSKAVGPNGRVYAVDIADNFVKHIEQKAKDEGLTNVVGVLCRPDSVELPENSIDVAYICDTYHHFEYPYKTMRSIHRALKPHGRVVLVDFHRIEGVSRDWIMGHVRAGQGVFTKEILECGFRQIDEKPELLEESYLVRFEKVASKTVP